MTWIHKISQHSPGLQAILNKWKSIIPGLVLFVHEEDRRIVLSSLIIPKDKRKQGLGSAIVRDLTNYADQRGKRIELSPGTKDKYNGTTSRNRLVQFYKGLGFRENRGRNKDYSLTETMFRNPLDAGRIASVQMRKLAYGGPAFNPSDYLEQYLNGDYTDSSGIYEDVSMELDLGNHSRDLLWFSDVIEPSQYTSGLTVEQCWKEDFVSGIDNFQNLVEWLNADFSEGELSKYDRSQMSSIYRLLVDWDFDTVGEEWDAWGPYKWYTNEGEWTRCRDIARSGERYPVSILVSGQVLDGAHRLAVAIYNRKRSYPALVGVPVETMSALADQQEYGRG